MSSELSAVNAMNMLLAQIEDRLRLNEDYRALKALERAIADVASHAAMAPLARVIAASPSAVILPQAAPPPAPRAAAPAPGSHSALMQRLTASFPGVSTAKAVPAGSVAA